MTRNPLLRVATLEKLGYQFEVCVDGFVVRFRGDLVGSRGHISGRYASTVPDRKAYRGNAKSAVSMALKHKKELED